MNKKIVVGVVVLVVLLAGLFLYNKGSGAEDSSADSVAVARVNGEEISRADLNASLAQLVAERGIDEATLDEAGRAELQTLAIDGLVSLTLIRQATVASGVVVSDAEIDAEIAGIKGQFESESEYLAQVSARGMTEPVLRSRIASDMAVRIYLEQTLNLSSVAVSDEEVEALYGQEAERAEDLPPLSEIEEQIRGFITSEKQQGLLTVHAQELRANADIEILI